MAYFHLKIGNYETIYQFDKEENDATNLPYCDANKNILKRINETEQEKEKITEVNTQVLRLEHKKDRTPQEEEQMKMLQNELNVRTQIQAYKPYYINEGTGETHQKAFKLMGDEILDGTDGRTKEIFEGDYAVCDKEEINTRKKQDKGTLFSQPLYQKLKQEGENKAYKFNMKFGRGNNEERVYVYPDEEIPNVLVINKTGRTKFKEVLIRNVEELRKYEELQEMLKAIDLENAKKSRNKIAGSLD